MPSGKPIPTYKIKRVLLLRDEGLSMREISEATGLSLFAVYKIINDFKNLSNNN